MDRFPDALIFQLRSSRDIVIDLTVKNLAMSSAMVITHHKNNNSQEIQSCLLYTSPSPRDRTRSRMPSSA